MKSRWLHKNRSEKVLIFFNGWGMDACPFVPLTAKDLDVLICFDYTDLDEPPDLLAAVESYSEVSLISWSMGVWAAQHVFSSMASGFAKSIAVNGTLCPIHNHHGIPVEIFAATNTRLNEATRLKFYRRMCRKPEILSYFLTHQPERTLNSQKKELESLLADADCLPVERSIYTHVIIAADDLVVPTENQRRFWQQKNTRQVDGAHFLFYDWESWDDMLQDLGKRGADENKG